MISCILADDAGNLNDKVVLFVDRDFDDIDSFCNVRFLFMTDRYSVENYLVCGEVLEGVLRDDFPLDGEPAKRAELLQLFEVLYAQFLEITQAANFRLFVAIMESIPRQKGFDPRLIHLVTFSLHGLAAPLEDHVVGMPLVREPTNSECESWQAVFALLSPPERYRGKFAYLFFRAFLRDLCQACRTGSEDWFDGVARPNVREGELSLGSLASRSPMPTGLSEFIAGLPA